MKFHFFSFILISVYLESNNAMAQSAVEASNKLAEEFTKDYSQLVPELGSSLGYREFDSKAACIALNQEERELERLRKWENQITESLKLAKEPDLMVDYLILQKMLKNSIRGQELSLKHGEIPVPKVSQEIYENLQILVNAQSPEERRKASVDRFKSYVNGTSDCKPLVEIHLERAQQALAKAAQTESLFPLKRSMEKYLKDAPQLTSGVKELLEKSGRSDWQDEFKRFEVQLEKYHSFLKDSILPKARTSYQLPLELYEHALVEAGIEDKAEELIKKGLEDYDKVYLEFRNLSNKIGKKLKLKSTDPKSVMERLKKDKITQAEDVKKLYANADKILAKIIQKNRLVTLPAKPLKIRLAGDAESAASPVPHLNPPPLVNNQGERPEFVVPTSSTGNLPYDDFSYKAAALVLTAHEGRPGHDLQFSSMLDNQVSIVRARYAFNSVNVEGWGLYAEDLVYPYLPLESQMVALQTRLWRIARMFLEPQIQLGKIQPERVIQLFTEELGVSREMAQLELNRYTFVKPGQAPTYYYGLLKLKGVRDAAIQALGKRFQLKCFNDAVLSVGLVPLEMVSKRLTSQLSCASPR
jgi:uncharacterized protein (DUF885 family)